MIAIDVSARYAVGIGKIICSQVRVPLKDRAQYGFNRRVKFVLMEDDLNLLCNTVLNIERDSGSTGKHVDCAEIPGI
jgi:hypothetical protein